MDYFTQSFGAALDLIIHFDREIYSIAWISLKISLIASCLAGLLGIPLGGWLALSRFPGSLIVERFLNTLMAMPTVVVGLIVYGLLNRQGFLGEFGLLYTQKALIIGEVVLILPIVTNLVLMSVKSADPQLISTLKSLGANRIQVLKWVLLELKFAVMIAVVTAFGRAIGEVGAAMMLGGNIQGITRTMTTAIALETSKGEFELGLALGVLLLILAFFVNWFLQCLSSRIQ